MANTECSAFMQPHVRPVVAGEGAATRLLRGTRVGLWRIVGEPRCGSLSDAYPAVFEETGDGALLTLFDAPALALGSYTRRILATAHNVNRIEHPGVSSVIDAGLAADGRPYLVHEMVEGVTLAERVGDDVLKLEHVITILRGICAPLAAAHEIGVVHGGLTMENVRLVEDRYVRLLDWGCERAVIDEARRAGVERVGSVRCMAPELAFGVVSPQADAYALGVIAFELMCGEPPFTAESNAAMHEAQQWAPRPLTLCPAIPEALDDLIASLLAHDPRMRPSVRAAAEQLAAIDRELSLPPPPTRPANIVSRVGMLRSRIVATTLAAAAITAVLLTAGNEESAAVGASVPLAVESAPRATSDRPSVAEPTPPPPVRSIPTTVAVMAPSAHPALQVGPTSPRVVAPAPAPPRAVKPAPPPAPARPVKPAAAPAPAPAAPVKPAAAPAPAPAAPVSTAAATPTSNAEPRSVSAVPPDDKAKLLTEYQRVGHALLELRRQRGPESTSELWDSFKALEIQPALASATSRANAKATLKELGERIERSKGVEVSDACRNNPLAAGCE